MVVFATAISSNPTSKIAIGSFYVFSLTEINNSHGIFGHLLMSWLTLMFSSFPARHKTSKLASSVSDFDVSDNLSSHVYPKVNLLKVTVSEYFLSQC